MTVALVATGPGDTEPGDTKPGDTEGGDTERGDPGDTERGDTERGDTEPDDTEPDDTECGDTKPGDTEPGDAKPGDTGGMAGLVGGDLAAGACGAADLGGVTFAFAVNAVRSFEASDSTPFGGAGGMMTAEIWPA
jgi:hypothetical protein